MPLPTCIPVLLTDQAVAQFPPIMMFPDLSLEGRGMPLVILRLAKLVFIFLQLVERRYHIWH
jgi:hypothetical protein